MIDSVQWLWQGLEEYDDNLVKQYLSQLYNFFHSECVTTSANKKHGTWIAL